MIHCAVCTSVPKAVMMLGRATTTPNMPNAIVNCPGKIAAAVHHFPRALAWCVVLLICIDSLSAHSDTTALCSLHRPRMLQLGHPIATAFLHGMCHRAFSPVKEYLYGIEK